MAREIDDNGELVNPVKVPWSSGGVFTTPPGMLAKLGHAPHLLDTALPVSCPMTACHIMHVITVVQDSDLQL